MTKREKIRNSYLLLTFSLLTQVFEDSKIDPRKINKTELDKYDLTIMSIFNWLKRIMPIYAKRNVQDFANKRLSKVFNRKWKQVDKLVVALMIFYLYLEYKRFNDKKDWIVPPINKDLLKETIEQFKGINNSTIDFSYECLIALDPEKKRIVEMKSKLGSLFRPDKLK